LPRHYPLEAEVLRQYFSPDKFLIKITPVNPTYRAMQNNLTSHIDAHSPDPRDQVVESLHRAGYEVIISIGNVEENQVGSNCGQYLRAHMNANQKLGDGYTYPLFPNT
jgi:23S rRNA (adenine2503-C2)-methyltransferase